MVKRQLNRSFLFFIILIVGLTSCAEIDKRFESTVRALGKSNEVVVIADQDLWEGMPGDSAQYYFGSPFPIMPQPEPMFDLRHFTTEEIRAERLRKELRTYLILADLTDEDSPTTQWVKEDLGSEKLRRASEDSAYISSVGRDKWARGQLIFYVFGYGEEQLSRNVVRAFPAIAERVNAHDERQVEASAYVKGENGTLTNHIRDKFGVILRIPGDYKTAIEDSNFIWIRKDTREITMNIAISSEPYSSQEQLSKENLIDMRDTLGLRIGSSEPGSYIRTNAEDLPVFVYDKELGGGFTREIRGIWEMEGDFLGGPFVSYAVLTPERDEIIFIDTFVFAPGVDKRNLVQQLEFIIGTLRFP